MQDDHYSLPSKEDFYSFLEDLSSTLELQFLGSKKQPASWGYRY
jgi:hypothetical protein